SLQGTVTVTGAGRASLPLRFKDDVFVGDRLETGQESLLRVLLGGKAVVTMRERSVVTLRETPGVSTLELDAGALALALNKDRLKPGDSVEIKTPDAVARIRGTIVVAAIVGDSTGMASRFTVMSGTAEVIPVATTAQTPAAITLEARQTVVVGKGTPAGPAETATANNAGPLVASILARSAPPPPRNLPAPPA